MCVFQNIPEIADSAALICQGTLKNNKGSVSTCFLPLFLYLLVIIRLYMCNRTSLNISDFAPVCVRFVTHVLQLQQETDKLMHELLLPKLRRNIRMAKSV